MCGIAAIFSRQAPVAPATIERATRSLYHRGPDGQRQWRSADGRAGLGHARLSIIDLATGDQPIANEDGRLADRRQRRAVRLRAHPRGARRAGPRLPHAIGQRDRAAPLRRSRCAVRCTRCAASSRSPSGTTRDGQLFAARDRFGIKPLYYTIHDGDVLSGLRGQGAFASWACRCVGIATRCTTSHFVVHPPDRTLFAGIYQLPPASYLLTDGEQVRAHPYWDWDYPRPPTTAVERRRARMGRATRASFEEAVRLRLRADVPVACYLSGGIDSCAVLGFAARPHRRGRSARTRSPSITPTTTKAIWRAIRRSASGAEFCRIDVRPETISPITSATRSSRRTAVRSTRMPSPSICLSRAVRDSGVKVVLTGEGSDEIFARLSALPARPGAVRPRRPGSRGPGARCCRSWSGQSGVSRDAPAAGWKPLDSVQRRLGFVPS